MPWLIALFMVMVYLIPTDSTFLPVHLPFNSALDRIFLMVLFLVWLVVSLRGQDRPRFKHSPMNAAIYVFVILCVASVALNLRDLTWDGEFTLSLKQMLLAFTYIVFFYIVASSLTREDVVPFIKLLVVLGAISAIGTVIEYRTGSNVFSQFAHIIPGAQVRAKEAFRAAAVRQVAGARAEFSGPTLHGLADATLLGVTIPFAMTLMTRDPVIRRRPWWGLAIVAVIAGCVATQEKTAIILIVVAIACTVAYRPRQYAPYWPLLIVAAIVVRIAAPHSISSLIYQFGHLSTSSSTTHRTSGFTAVGPYIATHLLFGRGYGSFAPQKYRILDDQMLGNLIQIGTLGLLAYWAMILTPIRLVHRAARRGLLLRDEMMCGVAVGCLTFFLSNFLYDTFSFRQGPYVFFFIAALAAAGYGYVANRGSTDASLPPPETP